MSQEKVDRYKQEKYNRKHNVKKRNIKKKLTYIAVTLVAIAFVIYLGYSVAVTTGLYTPPTEPYSMSKAEIASLRQTLIEKNDSNVRGEITTAPAVDAGDQQVVDTNTEQATKTAKKSSTKSSATKKTSKKTATKEKATK